jgi:proton-translocating NADH-quinone oxidoreductase chain M
MQIKFSLFLNTDFDYLFDYYWLFFQLENYLYIKEKFWLFFTLVFPLISMILVFFFSFSTVALKKKLYNLSLFLSAISFLGSLNLLLLLKKNYVSFQAIFLIKISPLISENWWCLFGVDFISVSLIILTNLFIFLCILSIQFLEIRGKFLLPELLTKLFFIQWGLNCAFSTLDLLAFYIFFEATLIPIFMIILQGGSRERKTRASYLIALYTLFGSIFMLFNIIYLSNKYGTTNYLILFSNNISTQDQKILWITFFLAFAVKIPVFPFHIWLPEAHVEAPTIGSVILAALLLKLGVYGLIRFGLPLFPQGQEYFKHLIVILTICSFFYTNLTAIRQVDIKKIIAYSSVVHMNLIVLGILCIGTESLDGAIYQMLAHGIVSGALFFCIGIIYDRFKTRFLWYFGGVAFIFPIYAIFLFIFILANISFPLTSNFIGEMLLFVGIFKDNFIIGVFAALSMFWGVIYNVWTYNRICFGNLKFNFEQLSIHPYNFSNNKNFNNKFNIILKDITWKPNPLYVQLKEIQQNPIQNTFSYPWLTFINGFRYEYSTTYQNLTDFIKIKYSMKKMSYDLNRKDFYILIILTFCLISTGIYSSIILDYVSMNSTLLIEHYNCNVFLK